jgi:hypothetical protein
MTAWRILTDGQGSMTAPLSAHEIADRLWAAQETSLWAEPQDGSAAALPQEIPEVRSVLLRDPVRVARAFLSRSTDWVFEWVMDLAEHHPEEVLPVVRALVRLAPNDGDLAFVAAGPLEELLKCHGPKIIAQVEAAAADDARFRLALSGVWRSTIEEAVWARVQALVANEPRLDG